MAPQLLLNIMASRLPTIPDRLLGKEESLQIEEHHNVPLYNAHVDISGVDEPKLLRKIDLALLPWLSLLYLLSFLDRTSIGKYASGFQYFIDQFC